MRDYNMPPGVRSWNIPGNIEDAEEVFGPQEPPQDYRIYNKRQPDGTFKPISGFFDKAEELLKEE